MTDQPNTPAVQHVAVEPYEPEVTATVPTTGALQRLEAEALAMDKAFKIAKALSNTEMVPEHFQQKGRDKTGQPHGESAAWNLAAAILYGSELGLSPTQAAQNVFVVKGKPAVYARTMAAQVRRAGYKIEEVSADNTEVVWRAERDGKWITSAWSIDRAKQAGYTSNAKYTSNPIEMLRAKCIAEVCRIQYQDVLLGMAYTVEELQLDSVTVQRVVKREPRGATALRDLATQNQLTASEPNPEPETAEQPNQTPENTLPDTVTDPDCLTPSLDEQIDKIKRIYKARGITGPAVLDDANQILQREQRLTALTKLAPEEAEVLLDVLLESSGDSNG